MTPSGTLSVPENPSLRSDCRVFEYDGNVFVRSSTVGLRIDPARRLFGRRLLSRLNGRYSLSEIVRGEAPDDLVYGLFLLGELTRHGMLHEDGAPVPPPISPKSATSRIPERQLGIIGAGRLVEAVTHHLAIAGARMQLVDAIGRSPVPDLVLVCTEGPDLKLLERSNLDALAANVSWIPIFNLGDELIVGPWIRPRVSACFRCFELRWLGISPSIAAERAYFNHLRNCGSTAIGEHEVDRAAAIALRVLSSWLSAAPVYDRLRIAPLSGEQPIDTWLIRHPLCDVCGTGHRPHSYEDDSAWDEPAVPLTELRQRLTRLAADRCGLAALTPAALGIRLPSSGMPTIAVARFALPEPDRVTGEQANWCHGCAETREDAETLAIIESLERYSGLLPAQPDVVAPYEAVANEAVLPTSLPLYSDAQYASEGFPFRPFRADQPICWTRAFSLTTMRSTLVPTSATYFGVEDTLLDETSSGVAAHSSRAEALARALLELVERDAFMIHWLNRLSPPLVDIERWDDPLIQRLLQTVSASGYEVCVADITTDLEMPASLAIGTREDQRGPALLVGAGAALDSVESHRRSLGELYAAVAAQPDRWSPGAPLTPDAVKRLEDHAAAYSHPDWLAHAAFLWESRERRSPVAHKGVAHSSGRLEAIVDRLSSRGLDVIGVDIAPPEIACHGIRVMRAIVPGLQPLGFGPSGWRLGGRRVFEAPVRMGRRTTPMLPEDLNLFPHCFP